MPKVDSAVRNIQSKLVKIATLSGDSKKVANQEVKQALDKGLITKAERDLIVRAISDSYDTDVKVIKERLGRYVEAFHNADKNGDGQVSKLERDSAKTAETKWMYAAASTTVPEATKKRLEKDVIHTTRTDKNGVKKQVVETGIGSLLDKLIKLNK